MPRKRCNPDLSVGVGISVIAATLAGSGSTPLSVSLCPMKVTEGELNCNFFTESRRSWLLHFSNRLVKFRRRETKVERTLYSTITNPNKRSKSLFHRRRPPLLLKESECRSISGIIGSRIVASPKNHPMTSPPLSFLNCC